MHRKHLIISSASTQGWPQNSRAQSPRAKAGRQKESRPAGHYSFLLLWSTLVPGAWSGLHLPPSWWGRRSHLKSVPTAVSQFRWPGRSSRPVWSPRTLTQRPPQLVCLVQGPVLEERLAAWSLAMPRTRLWSSSYSPMPFWALPYLRLCGSSIWWSSSSSISPCEAPWRSPTHPCCLDSRPCLLLDCAKLYH